MDSLENFEQVESDDDPTEQGINPPALIGNVAAVKRFILAGEAIFTVVSCKTGDRLTYRVSQGEASNGYTAPWFVSLLTGPDNRSDYTYLGMIASQVDPETGRTIPRAENIRLTKASKLGPESRPVAAFNWLLRSLFAGRLAGFEVWHAGRCGRCGRPLTVPESIATGLGPVCAGLA